MLDEPLSMLDAASASDVARRIDRLRGEGTAVVVFEHREGPFARLGLAALLLAGVLACR